MQEAKKIKVYMGIPSNGNVIDSQAYLLREIEDLYKDHVELVYPDVCVRRIFHDYARNSIVEDFLATDCDILWFLDSDITPNKHVLDLVAVHGSKWQVAGLTYPVFMNMPGSSDMGVVFTCYHKNPETGGFSIRSVPMEGQEFVDGLATGCLFIKREVFEKLEKPYFEFKYREDTREMKEGEDLGFIRKCSALGIRMFTDFKLMCKHQKSVDLLDVNNYAISYSNKTLLSYKELARQHMQEILDTEIAKAFKVGFSEGVKQNIDKHLKPKKNLIETPTLWVPR